MKIASRLQVAFSFLVLFPLLAFGGAQQSHKMKPMPYAKVASLIKAQCASCHNATRHPEKVDLSSYQALMKSGEHGPIVVAGHPEKSKLILYVDGTKQPRMPMGKAPLSKADIAMLKSWIASGAKG
jgi:uncharacterized membrane protein